LGPGELVGEPRGEVSHGALVSVEARGLEVRVTWWILMDMVIGTRSRDRGLEMWGVGAASGGLAGGGNQSGRRQINQGFNATFLDIFGRCGLLKQTPTRHESASVMMSQLSPFAKQEYYYSKNAWYMFIHSTRVCILNLVAIG
jgi:hypothetical protein